MFNQEPIELKRQVRSILSVVILSVICFAVTAVQWFGVQDYSVLAPKQGYSATIQAVQAATLPYSGENLLWYESNITYCDQIIPVPQDSSSISVVVSNLSSSDLSMSYGYMVSWVDANGNDRLTENKFRFPPLAPGESTTIAVAAGPKGECTAIRLQVFTAPQGQTLEVYPWHVKDMFCIDNLQGITYLANDQTLQKPLTIRNADGVLCLGGHTLSVPSLEVIADSSRYGVLTITDGTLIINGQVVTDGSPAVASQGKGNTVVKYQGLREN